MVQWTILEQQEKERERKAKLRDVGERLGNEFPYVQQGILRDMIAQAAEGHEDPEPETLFAFVRANVRDIFSDRGPDEVAGSLRQAAREAAPAYPQAHQEPKRERRSRSPLLLRRAGGNTPSLASAAASSTSAGAEDRTPTPSDQSQRTFFVGEDWGAVLKEATRQGELITSGEYTEKAKRAMCWFLDIAYETLPGEKEKRDQEKAKGRGFYNITTNVERGRGGAEKTKEAFLAELPQKRKSASRRWHPDKLFQSAGNRPTVRNNDDDAEMKGRAFAEMMKHINVAEEKLRRYLN